MWNKIIQWVKILLIKLGLVKQTVAQVIQNSMLTTKEMYTIMNWCEDDMPRIDYVKQQIATAITDIDTEIQNNRNQYPNDFDNLGLVQRTFLKTKINNSFSNAQKDVIINKVGKFRRIVIRPRHKWEEPTVQKAIEDAILAVVSPEINNVDQLNEQEKRNAIKRYILSP